MSNREIELTVAGNVEIIRPKRRRRNPDTDSEGRTGRAGYGCVLRCGDLVKIVRNSLTTTSPARAELAGIVEGLRRLRRPGLVRIYRYDSCTTWQLGTLLRKPSQSNLNEFPLPEENIDLWRDFVELTRTRRTELRMALDRLVNKDYDRALSAARRGLLSGYREWYVRNPGPRISYDGVQLF